MSAGPAEALDDAIRQARYDVVAARLRALLWPDPDMVADVAPYEQALDGLLDARPAYHRPEEAP